MSYSFFGLQVAVRSTPGDPWRERLVALLRENLTNQGVVEKRAFYGQLADLLEESESRWALGTWDLVSGAKAETEFDSWAAGLEGSVDEPLDTAAPPGDHAVVSVVFLVEAESRAGETLGMRCDIPEPAWFTRATFGRLVATLRSITFSGVRADGAYVVPGDVGYAIPYEELRGEGWDYLEPVR